MPTNLAKVFSAELDGIDARPVDVEVDINVGLHSFSIVGLADKALSEAKERVNSALKNSGVKPPNKENRKITVNLAPADFKKTGSHYDLAIAVGYLLATGQIQSFDTTGKIFVGELSLDGSLRPIHGALNIAELAAARGFSHVLLPAENAKEAAIVRNINIIPLTHLKEVIDHLENRAPVAPLVATFSASAAPHSIDISEIKGQENAKRALLIAAAGGHNLLMSGPPGAGKSMLAQALTSILPPPTLQEAIEITKIYSAAGLTKRGIIDHRPFRSPHQSASTVSVIGGGANPKPGEISLAHRGVLFLDELPEFHRDLLEALRQPMETGLVHVARARNTLVFPARFTLVAAMNPCPCGYFSDPERECTCTAHEVFRYQKKISGPLLDRIDLQINVPRITLSELRAPRDPHTTNTFRAMLAGARAREGERFKETDPTIHANAEMSAKQCDAFIPLDASAETFLKDAIEGSFLSARGYYRILKTARTIADLEGSEHVQVPHLAEAFSYRIRLKE